MIVIITALKNRFMVTVGETTMYVTERTSDAVCQAIGSSDVTIDSELLDSIKDIFGTEHLDSAKAIMLARVTAYDQSEAVNSFRIGNMTLRKENRSTLTTCSITVRPVT